MRGKASFRVRHHAARPFTASGRLSEVRVLGTRFLLDESRNDTAFVHVEAGKVQYTAVGQPDAVILTRGMRAQVVKGQQKPQVLSREHRHVKVALCSAIRLCKRYSMNFPGITMSV